MREYRGKRVDGKGWAYGWYFVSLSGFHYIKSFYKSRGKLTRPPKTTQLNRTVEHKVIPETVGQYLRKDKNDEDIYSNQPIRYRDKDYPNGFVWDESGLRWTLNDGYFHTHYGRTGTGGEDDYLDLEVIGNTTDNPNLLESPK